jgi:hypothetical protein
MIETSKQSKGLAWQNWQKIGLCAAIVALICFFMPWVEIGSSFIGLNLTGWQLATGIGPGGSGALGRPSLFLILLSMLAVIVVIGAPLIGWRLPIQIEARQIPRLLIVAGGLSLLVIVYQYFNLNSEINRGLIGAIVQARVEHVSGWTLTMLCSAAVLAAGIMELRANNNASQSPPTSRVDSWTDQS